jgi:uncharacterized protein YbbK (DUF523 family)
MRKHMILISSCLIGRPVRYDGTSKLASHPAIERWLAEGRFVPICPELEGGFAVPRAAAEIAHGKSGADVLAGDGQVVELIGSDVTDGYIAGALAALSLARAHDCRFALLTDGSPSCGSSFIYNGSFEGKRKHGLGVTSALLRENGIEVYSEDQIDALEARLSASKIQEQCAAFGEQEIRRSRQV